MCILLASKRFVFGASTLPWNARSVQILKKKFDRSLTLGAHIENKLIWYILEESRYWRADIHTYVRYVHFKLLRWIKFPTKFRYWKNTLEDSHSFWKPLIRCLRKLKYFLEEKKNEVCTNRVSLVLLHVLLSNTFSIHTYINDWPL